MTDKEKLEWYQNELLVAGRKLVDVTRMLIDRSWHTGTPTEEGDYLCIFDSATCPLYGWCIWDGKWGYLSGYNPSVYRMIAWQKITPFEENEK